MEVTYHLTYEVDSPGEVEEIEGRLRATSPQIMDVDQDEARVLAAWASGG